VPDANKRADFVLTARSRDANGLQWGPPDVDANAGLLERVAAAEATHEEVVDWIRERSREKEMSRPPSPEPGGKAQMQHPCRALVRKNRSATRDVRP
jgi:hypothetical protein